MDSRFLVALRQYLRHPDSLGRFFHGRTKAETEARVLSHFARCFGRLSHIPLGLTRMLDSRRGRPDAMAIRPDGRRVAIEITELCSMEARARNARAFRAGRLARDRVLARWSVAAVREGLAERLLDKNGKTEPGWDAWWVVIHEDQPLLAAETIDRALGEGGFSQVGNIDRAYLLSAYGPRGCALREIGLGGR